CAYCWYSAAESPVPSDSASVLSHPDLYFVPDSAIHRYRSKFWSQYFCHIQPHCYDSCSATLYVQPAPPESQQAASPVLSGPFAEIFVRPVHACFQQVNLLNQTWSWFTVYCYVFEGFSRDFFNVIIRLSRLLSSFSRSLVDSLLWLGWTYYWQVVIHLCRRSLML